MSEPLPVFRYHPDPVRTGSIAASVKECRCCGRSRGYIYTLAPYTEEERGERPREGQRTAQPNGEPNAVSVIPPGGFSSTRTMLSASA